MFYVTKVLVKGVGRTNLDTENSRSRLRLSSRHDVGPKERPPNVEDHKSPWRPLSTTKPQLLGRGPGKVQHETGLETTLAGQFCIWFTLTPSGTEEEGKPTLIRYIILPEVVESRRSLKVLETSLS